MIRTFDRLGHCLSLWHGLSDLVIFLFFRWQHLYLLSLYRLSSIRTQNRMPLLGRLMESVADRVCSPITGQHISLTSEHNIRSYFRALLWETIFYLIFYFLFQGTFVRNYILFNIFIIYFISFCFILFFKVLFKKFCSAVPVVWPTLNSLNSFPVVCNR